MTNADIMEVFGEFKIFRFINPTLDPATKLEFLCLYSKCYGHSNVNNNEFYLWFVKGYIVPEKGLDIDWAKAAASTTRGKFRKEEIAKWKLVLGATSRSHNRSGMKIKLFLQWVQGQRIQKHELPSSKTFVDIISKFLHIITPIVVVRV